MSSKTIFTEFFTKTQDEARRCRRGKDRSQVSTIAQDAWFRLSIADRTAFNIFCNAVEGRPDKVSMLGDEMLAYFQGHDAETLLKNPDFVVCLKLYLGE
jgi:hypothetical protein